MGLPVKDWRPIIADFAGQDAKVGGGVWPAVESENLRPSPGASFLAFLTRLRARNTVASSIQRVLRARHRHPIPPQGPRCTDMIGSLRPAPGVYCVLEEGRAVLLHSTRGEYFGLNAVGARVWAAIQAADRPSEADSSELLEELTADYQIGREQLEEDILKFLRHLVDNQLVRSRD